MHGWRGTAPVVALFEFRDLSVPESCSINSRKIRAMVDAGVRLGLLTVLSPGI